MATPPTGNPEGAPSKWKPEFVDEAYKLCLLGCTDKEMAEYFDIAVSTLNQWKLEKPEFLESIKNGKEKADSDVADSLRRRAQGFEYIENQPVKLKEVIYENGKRVRETERVEIVPVTKTVPPDSTSMIFWLKNRRKKQWRDKHEVEHSGEVNDLAGLTDEELDERIRRYRERRQGTSKAA